MSVRMTKFRTWNKVLHIEMNGSNISSTLGKGVEYMHTLYMKSRRITNEAIRAGKTSSDHTKSSLVQVKKGATNEMKCCYRPMHKKYAVTFITASEKT